MTFDEFIQALGNELQELFGWNPPRRTLGEEREQVEKEIEELKIARARCRTGIAQWRKNLAGNELRAARLMEQVEIYLHVNDRPNAWQHALQLDRLRHAIGQDRCELRRRRRALFDLRSRLHGLRHRLAGYKEHSEIGALL
jgi:hypothetical protein